MDPLHHIMVVVPAFNAGAFLGVTLKSLLEILAPDKILVVDDGSTDNTSATAINLGVHCISHPINRGKGTALVTGLEWLRAKGVEWGVTVDADGQHSAGDIAKFLSCVPNPLTAIVIGKRKGIGTNMPWHRRFSNFTTTRLISMLAGTDVFDSQSGFRMYKTSLIADRRIPRLGRFEWEPQILILASRLGYRLQSVDVRTIYSRNGSHMRLVRDTIRFLAMCWRTLWIT